MQRLQEAAYCFDTRNLVSPGGTNGWFNTFCTIGPDL
jgi:hypothetical protein